MVQYGVWRSSKASGRRHQPSLPKPIRLRILLESDEYWDLYQYSSFSIQRLVRKERKERRRRRRQQRVGWQMDIIDAQSHFVLGICSIPLKLTARTREISSDLNLKFETTNFDGGIGCESWMWFAVANLVSAMVEFRPKYNLWFFPDVSQAKSGLEGDCLWKEWDRIQTEFEVSWELARKDSVLLLRTVESTKGYICQRARIIFARPPSSGLRNIASLILWILSAV